MNRWTRAATMTLLAAFAGTDAGVGGGAEAAVPRAVMVEEVGFLT